MFAKASRLGLVPAESKSVRLKMTANSATGWDLIAAVVIGIVASSLAPGGLIIDPADTASFTKAAGVLGDNFIGPGYDVPTGR